MFLAIPSFWKGQAFCLETRLKPRLNGAQMDIAQMPSKSMVSGKTLCMCVIQFACDNFKISINKQRIL